MPASGDVYRPPVRRARATQRIYSPTAPSPQSNGAGALWAAERAALLAASDDRDREELVSFSRSYSVASPDVSFIVLETGRDYAMAHFEPPASLPAPLLDEYRQVREQMKEQETAQRAARLQTVLPSGKRCGAGGRRATTPRGRAGRSEGGGAGAFA